MRLHTAETKPMYVLRTKANGILNYKEIFRFSKILLKLDYRMLNLPNVLCKSYNKLRNGNH